MGEPTFYVLARHVLLAVSQECRCDLLLKIPRPGNQYVHPLFHTVPGIDNDRQWKKVAVHWIHSHRFKSGKCMFQHTHSVVVVIAP